MDNQKKIGDSVAKAYQLLINSLKESYFELQKNDNPNVKAIGGLMIMITSQAWRISEKVISDSMKHKNSNATRDVQEIKKELCRFLDEMIKEHNND